MTITLTNFQIVSLAFHCLNIFLIIFLLWLGNRHRRSIWVLEEFKKGLIAHAKAAPPPPTAELIKQWTQTHDVLPDASPKKTAYRNRLIEVGVLDEDGRKIKVEHGA